MPREQVVPPERVAPQAVPPEREPQVVRQVEPRERRVWELQQALLQEREPPERVALQVWELQQASPPERVAPQERAELQVWELQQASPPEREPPQEQALLQEREPLLV